MHIQKTSIILLTGLILVNPAYADATLKSKKDKESYGVGADIGANLKRMGVEMNLDALFKGIKDAFTTGKLALSEAELNGIMQAYHTELRARQMSATKEKMEMNQKAGDDYMAKFRAEKDVVALPSGVLYKVIKEGHGAKPVLDDTVECRYKGFLVDGTQFDGTGKDGAPISFNVKSTIPGWTEIVPMMPVGSSWKVVIPPRMAYGAVGVGGKIGPNSTLVFEIELVSIKPREQPPTGQEQPATESK
jgi:FKBP-type peptidyl-prolyl cis-trans isomerase FklB